MLSSTRLGDAIHVMHNVAQLLLDEHRRGAPFKPFAANNGIDCLDAAYRVQAAYVGRLLASGGGARVGYKIGPVNVLGANMVGGEGDMRTDCELSAISFAVADRSINSVVTRVRES
jgi:2-keto-4-pentenoate hydratase